MMEKTEHLSVISLEGTKQARCSSHARNTAGIQGAPRYTFYVICGYLRSVDFTVGTPLFLRSTS